ncbi:MAG: ATP-binding protein [Actinobacteria bacterium]|nr:ATP-binding protein [Actinomycetota bacterium]
MISGQVIYTANAFGQDGELAIKRDVLLALLELITNADDAYAGEPGKVMINISKPDPVTGAIDLSVADHAKGLSPQMLLEKFTVLGGANEQFQEGDNPRGLLGRGAKDVASLGSVTFATIKDEVFSSLTLQSDGSYTAEEGTPALAEHREFLNLNEGQNGLTATMHIQCKALKIKVPSLNILSNNLSTHEQLRDLIQRREIYLSDKRSTSPALVIEYSELPSTQILNEKLKVPGYDHEVELVLNRLDSYVSGKPGPYSPHGILVKSGVTIYKNVAFGNESHPSMGFISGHVYSPEINSLIRRHDLKGDVDGGRLIRRDRVGLVKEHPYTIALTKAVNEHLLPILSKIQQENATYQGQGESLTRALKDAARALRSDVNELMKELEEEVKGTGDDTQPDIQVIPPQLKIHPDSVASLTVRVKGSSEVSVTGYLGNSDKPDLVSVTVPSPVVWTPHERLDASVTSIQVIAGSDVGNGVVSVNVGGVPISVPVVVVNPADVVLEPVTKLEFVTPNARIAPTRNRKLELRAPISDSDNAVEISVAGVDIASYPGEVILKAAPTGLWSSAFVDIKTSTATGELTITATNTANDVAIANLLIQEGGPTGGLDLDFELVRGKDSATRANLWQDGGILRMLVHTDHPAFDGVFGKFDEGDKKYSNEDSPQARQALVEVLSMELGEYFTVQQSVKSPIDFTDGPQYFARSHELANRFIKVFNAALKAK